MELAGPGFCILLLASLCLRVQPWLFGITKFPVSFKVLTNNFLWFFQFYIPITLFLVTVDVQSLASALRVQDIHRLQVIYTVFMATKLTNMSGSSLSMLSGFHCGGTQFV